MGMIEEEKKVALEAVGIAGYEAPISLKFKVEVASFWRRLLAFVIDSILVGVTTFLIGTFVFVLITVTLAASWVGAYGETLILPPILTTLTLFFMLVIIFAGVFLIMPILYFSVMESSKSGATVGKKALGIKVIRLDGKKISFARAFGRNASKILSILTLLVGFIIALFTKRKQSLHDIIAKTLVVNKTWTPIVKEVMILNCAETGQTHPETFQPNDLESEGNKYKIQETSTVETVGYTGNVSSEMELKTDVYKNKKPIKKWVLFVVIGLLSIILGFGIGKNISEPPISSTPVPVDLTKGIWRCGKDIAPGTYVVTPLDDWDTGELYVGGSTRETVIFNDSDGVKEVTVTLEEGDFIRVSGMAGVHFEPVQSVESEVSSGSLESSDAITSEESETVAVEETEVDEKVTESQDGQSSDEKDSYSVEENSKSTQETKSVDLGVGTWTCGVDVAPGEYTLTTASGTASITVSGSGYETTIIDDYDSTFADVGDSSFTCTLEEGDIVEISSSTNSIVHFEPASKTPTPGSVDLGIGTWTCGVDIAPGQYTITAVEGSANLIISGTKYDTAYIDSYNTHFFDYGDSSTTVTLYEGDTIEITGSSVVHFEPIN